MEKKETINIIRDYEAKKRLKVEKRLQKFFSEMMRIIGVICLFGFSMIGAITFYTAQGIDTNIFGTIMISTMVIVTLYVMTQCEDEWK